MATDGPKTTILTSFTPSVAALDMQELADAAEQAPAAHGPERLVNVTVANKLDVREALAGHYPEAPASVVEALDAFAERISREDGREWHDDYLNARVILA